MGKSKSDTDEMRIIMLSGDVAEEKISETIKELMQLSFNDEDKPICIVLETYGGEIHSMFSLYDVIHSLETPIHITALGKCMSAGVPILASGTKGKRQMGKNATLMIHPVRSISFGSIFEQEHNVEEIRRLQTLLEQSIVDNSNLSLEDVQKIMSDDTEKYYTAEEAKQMGIIDKVMGE